ncbi:MAG: hypothetical protein P4L58_02630, partial [Candidatus Pacebacteria bacterium]|nr:hypothetical protein [Candidatus Paceibacterota bacterium]
ALVLIIGLLLLGIVNRVGAQELPTYTLIHVESGLRIYKVGAAKHDWGRLYFPRSSGMIFKLDNDEQEVFFSEKVLSRNTIINKKYLSNVPVILLVVEDSRKKYSISYELYTQDACAAYMLSGP